MKPERLLAKYSLFQNDTSEEQYIKMKDAFGLLLNRTAERCRKYCQHRSDQERYASVCDAAVPGLIARRAMIDSSIDRVLLELEKIDALNRVDEKIAAIKVYAKGLAETPFNALFMVILSGELKKRWLPMAEDPIPTAEFNASNNLTMF
ncbi:hypothetical protein [Legionella shakespearei]|uniref:Uncharacterized protein n=1 Tax=Legionella shakespearei DSM 23087 TaxID=1122169 RepID=A0A0W0YTP4_9GAMM|nr:hypothetical protein [Legionella shakespearei]KTD60030.1 hypothetical protein Lsha_1780 [Legionella shakespearei DSM 23087]